MENKADHVRHHDLAALGGAGAGRGVLAGHTIGRMPTAGTPNEWAAPPRHLAWSFQALPDTIWALTGHFRPQKRPQNCPRKNSIILGGYDGIRVMTHRYQGYDPPISGL